MEIGEREKDLSSCTNGFRSFVLNPLCGEVMVLPMRCLPLFPGLMKTLLACQSVVLVFFLTGCASKAPRSPRDLQYKPPSEVERNIRSYMKSWEGTPHRMGGAGADGVDCSALVMLTYRDLFDIELPRSTAEQIKAGRRISLGNLEAGDLIFFLLPGKKRHVGIYLSKGDFVHVSSGQGVTISNLYSRYWRRAYWTARRVLPL